MSSEEAGAETEGKDNRRHLIPFAGRAEKPALVARNGKPLWTNAREERLRELCVENLSTAAIAADLGGITRNAVIGKMHRLGITNNYSRNYAAVTPGRKRRVAYSRIAGGNGQDLGIRARIRAANGEKPPPRSYAPAKAIAAPPEPLRLSLMELTDHTCKWPYGDPRAPDFHFCGHEPEPPRAYCQYHLRLAYHAVAEAA